MGHFMGHFEGQKKNCPVWERIGITPRRWQAEALPLALEAVENKKAAIVQAVMGAGKSKFIAALVASVLREGACIVVTTPRKSLVKQLSQTFEEALPWGTVGRYYAAHKEPARAVIVACDASTEKLAASLARLGRAVDLWIADECHGSEADRIKGWLDTVKPRARIGLTATPQRAKKTEGLTLWEAEIYRYDAAAALRDGVVVPFEIVHWLGLPCPLDDAMIEMIHEHKHYGAGIVDARNIEDAECFAGRLVEEGISAMEIHSEMSDGEIARRLGLLKSGAISVLVHVSLLKEGVDLPFLRWMGLRRQVASKVYFAQHVGRVLRADEGKEIAYILDPGDLFSRHKINLEAVLEAEAPPELTVIKGGLGGGKGEKDEEEEADAVAMCPYLSMLRGLCVELSTAGRFEPPPAGAWRDVPISPKQRAAIEGFANSLFGKRLLGASPHVNLFRKLYAKRAELTKGQASDLLSVWYSLPH